MEAERRVSAGYPQAVDNPLTAVGRGPKGDGCAASNDALQASDDPRRASGEKQRNEKADSGDSGSNGFEPRHRSQHERGYHRPERTHNAQNQISGEEYEIIDGF